MCFFLSVSSNHFQVIPHCTSENQQQGEDEFRACGWFGGRNSSIGPGKMVTPLHHGRICSASVGLGDVTGVGKDTLRVSNKKTFVRRDGKSTISCTMMVIHSFDVM